MGMFSKFLGRTKVRPSNGLATTDQIKRSKPQALPPRVQPSGIPGVGVGPGLPVDALAQNAAPRLGPVVYGYALAGMPPQDVERR